MYKRYNAQDVETERAVRKALEAYPLPEYEWKPYALDQRIIVAAFSAANRPPAGTEKEPETTSTPA